MEQLCAPAIIYLIFSIVQILIDTFKGLYNTALMKVIVMIMVTFLLQILCKRGLNVISWIIVFIPFILMTVIVSLLLYFFGLNSSTGKINYTCKDKEKVINTNTTTVQNTYTDSQGNIIIYDPYYDPVNNPVYYKSPNIIIPKPVVFPK
jgi:predicted membrane protein